MIAHAFEQPVARRFGLARDDQRAVDQLGERFDRCHLIHVFTLALRQQDRGVEREPPCEDRQAPKEGLHRWRQQSVAPVERGLQCPLPGQGGTVVSLGKDRRAAHQSGLQSACSEQRHACRSQLQRK